LGEIITLYRAFYKKNTNFVKKHTNLKAYADVRRILSRQWRSEPIFDEQQYASRMLSTDSNRQPRIKRILRISRKSIRWIRKIRGSDQTYISVEQQPSTKNSVA